MNTSVLPSLCVTARVFPTFIDGRWHLLPPRRRSRANVLTSCPRKWCGRWDPRVADLLCPNQLARCMPLGGASRAAIRSQSRHSQRGARWNTKTGPILMRCSSGCAFARGMFDEEDMRDCAAHFTRLMQQAMSAPDAPLSHMAFYPAADRSPSDNESLPLPGRPSAPFEAIALPGKYRAGV